MSYLYITENGAVLGVEGGYFVVKNKDGSLRKVPKETLESVALFGNISITTPCIQECLQRGIAVNYFSPRGAFFGRLESTAHKNIKRLKKQLLLSEDSEFCSVLAKRIINAKISNQLVVLKRYQRNTDGNIDDEIKMLKIARDKALGVHTIEEIMGYEGMAAKSYFKGLSKLVKPEFAFHGRSRRPPQDAFNSMLSLGYTILMYEIYGEIVNKDLSPYGGFIHKDHERHPTLASDLMEEWRAVIVDSVVMSLVQGNEIDIEHFFKAEEENGGIFIDNTGMKIFLNKMGMKLRSETGYLESSYRMSFRRALWHQVNELTKAVEEQNAYLYNPIKIR